MTAELLEQVTALAQAGKQQEARELLVQMIAADVHNETAWLWYAQTLGTEENRIKALEECLHHNPDCREAHERITTLKASRSQSSTSGPEGLTAMSPSMADVFSLTCPSCGGKLQITKDIERFACGHCGNEHIVKRSGGVLSLAPVVEGLRKVRVGVDKTASELAIRRLSEEIQQLQLQRTAIERTSNAKIWDGRIFGSILGILAGLVAGAIADDGLVFGLVFLIVASAGTIWGYIRQRQENSEKFGWIDNEIYLRTREFRKHRALLYEQ